MGKPAGTVCAPKYGPALPHDLYFESTYDIIENLDLWLATRHIFFQETDAGPKTPMSTTETSSRETGSTGTCHNLLCVDQFIFNHISANEFLNRSKQREWCFPDRVIFHVFE